MAMSSGVETCQFNMARILKSVLTRYVAVVRGLLALVIVDCVCSEEITSHCGTCTIVGRGV